MLSDPWPTHQERLTLGHPHFQCCLYPQRAVNLGHLEREDELSSVAVEMGIVRWRQSFGFCLMHVMGLIIQMIKLILYDS